MLVETLSFSLGIISTLIALLWIRSRPQSKEGTFRFFLNIFIINRKELVSNMVSTKLSRFPLLSAFAGKAAGILSSDSMLANKLEAQLIAQIPLRMQDMGVRCNATCPYKLKSYLIIEMEINAVDAKKLITIRGGEATAKLADSWLGLIGRNSSALANGIDALIVSSVGAKIKEKVPHVLQERLHEKGLEVETYACSSAEQGDFMLQALAHLS